MMNRWLLSALAVVVVACVGCGSGGPAGGTAKVSGTLTVDGNPVQGATVTFALKNGDHVREGKTDANGKFTIEDAGVGKNQITVTKVADSSEFGGDAESGLDDGQASAVGAAQGAKGTQFGEEKSEIPEKYADPKSSGLEEDVPAGGKEDVKLELKSS